VHYRIAFLAAVWLSLVSAGENVPAFPPLASWKAAITEQNPSALKTLYSSSPPAQVSASNQTLDAASEVAFWISLKPKGMQLKVIQSDANQPGIYQVLFQASLETAARTMYVTAVQVWQQQAAGWRIVASKREVTKLEQPLSIDDKIYPSGDAHTEIREALGRARRLGKRVLVVFGADWCYDCHVLDKAFHRHDIAAILNPNYEVVHIDVGQGDKNQDLMSQYQVPMKRGIPAIAILEFDGKLLYSQKNGEWERTRALGPEDLLELLSKWKPHRPTRGAGLIE
jgi:thioredoxin family protein